MLFCLFICLQVFFCFPLPFSSPIYYMYIWVGGVGLYILDSVPGGLIRTGRDYGNDMMDETASQLRLNRELNPGTSGWKPSATSELCPCPWTNYGKITFGSVAAKLWKNLPPDIRNINENETFRKKLKAHSFHNNYLNPWVLAVTNKTWWAIFWN